MSRSDNWCKEGATNWMLTCKFGTGINPFWFRTTTPWMAKPPPATRSSICWRVVVSPSHLVQLTRRSSAASSVDLRSNPYYIVQQGKATAGTWTKKHVNFGLVDFRRSSSRTLVFLPKYLGFQGNAKKLAGSIRVYFDISAFFCGTWKTGHQ